MEVSTFVGVFVPGKWRVGPALLNSTSRFGGGIQRRLRFLQDTILKTCRYTPVFLKISVGHDVFEKQAPRSDEMSIYGWKYILDFFLRKW